MTLLKFCTWIIVILCINCEIYSSHTTGLTDSKHEAVFKFCDLPTDSVFLKLKELHWEKKYEITPRTYIFRHSEKCKNISNEIADVKLEIKECIIDIQTVKNYPGVFTTYAPLDEKDDEVDDVYENQDKVCSNYYGMGIEDAWERGYSGKGVVVAVTDAGMNMDLLDLEPNVKKELCYNFMADSVDVTPERFLNYEHETLTDHGNNCAGIIAAVKGNEICSAGIAYNAKIAPLKIFTIGERNGLIVENSDSKVMSRAHVFGKDKIDIYSNSWGPEKMFYKINLDQREALKKSAKQGRGGQGAIHVFPVGKTGNDLANSEFTIAVSAIGLNGTVPTDHVISSSVITSGLLNGNNISAKTMMTTSRGNRCTRQFKGISAATAQVAGMIALALEANPQLTLPDVQDLLVYSSELMCLENSCSEFSITKNAAGHNFHPVFGFGLLNASKLVELSSNREEGLETGSVILRQTTCYKIGGEICATFCYSCSLGDESVIISQQCIRKVKTVKIQVEYKTNSSHMRIMLVSPSGTLSVIQDIKDSVSLKTERRFQSLTSVHFWDEKPYGKWRFNILSDGTTHVIGKVNITLFGDVTDITDDGLPGTDEGNVRCNLKSTDCISSGTSKSFCSITLLSMIYVITGLLPF